MFNGVLSCRLLSNIQMVSGSAAMEMINSAGVAVYLERCVELLPLLSRSDAFNLQVASVSSVLRPLRLCSHRVVLCALLGVRLC